MDISVRKRSQVQVIHLRGQLRLGQAVDELRQTIEESIGNGDTRFAINLADVPMVDSSGIGLLIAASNTLAQKNGKLTVVNTAPEILRLMQSMRLVSRLNISGRLAAEPSHE